MVCVAAVAAMSAGLGRLWAQKGQRDRALPQAKAVAASSFYETLASVAAAGDPQSGWGQLPTDHPFFRLVPGEGKGRRLVAASPPEELESRL